MGYGRGNKWDGLWSERNEWDGYTHKLINISFDSVLLLVTGSIASPLSLLSLGWKLEYLYSVCAFNLIYKCNI